MTRPLIRPALAALSALLLAAAAAAAQTVPNAAGQPPLVVRSEPAYYVWVDAGGWHVRWTTPAPALFSGSVVSDAEITGARRAGGVAVLTRLAPQHLVFGSPAFAGTGGFDFQTAGRVVTLNLQVNGRAASPAQVYVGRQALHPAGVPFAVAGVPGLAGGEGRSAELSDIERPVDRDPMGP